MYWLTWGQGAGPRVPTENARSGGAAPVSFPAMLQWQPRSIYIPALLNGDADNFFGPALDSADPVTQPLTLTNLSPGAPGSSALTVTMQGGTAGSHSVVVTLNGAQVGMLSFSDQANSSSTFMIANSLLVAGANTLGLTTSTPGDVTLVDTVQLSYPHTYMADGDSLNFTAPAGAPVTVGGFSDGPDSGDGYHGSIQSCYSSGEQWRAGDGLYGFGGAAGPGQQDPAGVHRRGEEPAGEHHGESRVHAGTRRKRERTW